MKKAVKIEGGSEMKKGWRTRLFGDNHFSFYGWIVAGLATVIGSMASAIMGVVYDNTNLILTAICVALLGIFSILLQNYQARLAEKLDATEQQN